MRQILIKIISFLLLINYSSQMNLFIEDFNQRPKKSMPMRMRTFNPFANKIMNPRKPLALAQHHKVAKQQKKTKTKNKLMLEEANERHRMFQLHPGLRHQGPSFHRDFYSNKV